MSAYLLDKIAREDKFRFGIHVRRGSLWVGAHWSPYNRGLCINIVPCVTVWIAWPGGRAP